MAKDFINDEDDDLLIKDGDFVVDASEEQEIAEILKSNPGAWKQNPLTGFGLVKKIRAEVSEEEIKKGIDTQLSLDGFRNINIKMVKGKITDIRATRD
jgi:hypothetical protein